MTTPRIDKSNNLSKDWVFDAMRLRNDIVKYCAENGCTVHSFYKQLNLSSSVHTKMMSHQTIPATLSVLLICKTISTDPMQYLVPRSEYKPEQRLITAWARYHIPQKAKEQL